MAESPLDGQGAGLAITAGEELERVRAQWCGVPTSEAS